MDLTRLNNAVMTVWGEKLQIKAGNITHSVKGVFIDAYANSPVGNTAVERPDPSFSFKKSEYNQVAATVGDLIVYDKINYSIISEPVFETGGWCNVAVRQYA